MTTFLHSGDMGDIIYSLPTIRAMGGGDLFLDELGGKFDEYVRGMLPVWMDRLKFDEESIRFLTPLLNAQSYISSTKTHNLCPVEINLNKFRNHLGTFPSKKSLCDAHFDAFGITEKNVSPWIHVVPNRVRPLVIARSARYQSSHLWWDMNHKYFTRQQCCFVGTELEYSTFVSAIDCDPLFVRTSTALELAEIIAGAEMFYGNQSLPMAIRIGLGMDFYQEVYPRAPNCVFNFGHYVEL